VTLDEQVIVVDPRPTVDVTSAQSGVVLPAAFTAAVPLPPSSSLAFPGTRSFEMAALAAPGAEADPLGVGFYGGASGENRYFVGGFDVTELNIGANLAPLVLDFIREVDVKTGNYMPKYGRASGGIVSAVTKSGSNELHGSVFTNLTPRWAFQPDGDFAGSDGQAFWSRHRNSRGAYDLDFGLELGGPIVRDRLWFHVGFAPVLTRNVTERELRANVLPDELGACPGGASDLGDGVCRDGEGAAVQEAIPAATQRWPADTRSYQFTGKLTWLASPEHTFTLATFGTPYTRETVATSTAEYRRFMDERETTVSATAGWTGRFFSRRLLVDALAGWMIDDYAQQRPSAEALNAAAVPAKFWFGPGFGPLPLGLLEPVPAECDGTSLRCLVADYATGGALKGEYRAQRFSARLSAAYLFTAFGAHVAELGVDAEHTGYEYIQTRPGGAYYNMTVSPTGSVTARAVGQGTLAVDPISQEVTPIWLDRMAFEPVMFTPALYLQDSWQPHPSITVNAGVRWESQSLHDRLRPDTVQIDIRDAIAPRAQVIWDPSGRGRSKLAVGWGRFYETPPLTLVETSFNQQFRGRYTCPGGTQISVEQLNPRTECSLVPDAFEGAPFAGVSPVRPVAPGIDGTFVDHFVFAAEHDIRRDVTVGIEYQGRRLGTVIEDMGTRDGDVFYLANPGVSPPFDHGDTTLDGRSVGGVDATTGREYTARVRRPERSYDGLTVKLTKSSARGLFGQAAYTVSQLRGDYAGRMQLDIDQYFAAGQTVDYDFAEFLPNRRGLLPGDRTHAVRFYGGYRWLPTTRLGLTLGAGLNSRSGTPVDIRGEAAPDALGYGNQLAFLVPRGRGGRTPWITQVDLRAELTYSMRSPWGARFTVDAFNVLDARSATAVDETYTHEQVMGIPNAACSGNPAARSNPSAAIVASCPDLTYLRTVDGRPVTVNRNWGRPTEFQTPVLLRFGAALTF
jgi:hypothetical protein